MNTYTCKCQIVLTTLNLRGKIIPLQHSAVGGGRGGYVSLGGAIALVKVGTADVVHRGGGKVLWWLLRPAKLLLSFTVDFD